MPQLARKVDGLPSGHAEPHDGDAESLLVGEMAPHVRSLMLGAIEGRDQQATRSRERFRGSARVNAAKRPSPRDCIVDSPSTPPTGRPNDSFRLV
jgi:hypothetical protein